MSRTVKSFLSSQRERIHRRLRYYEQLGTAGGVQRPPEYIALKKTLIPRLKEALARLEQGLYGICKGCGCVIPHERLLAIPAAYYCRECQQRTEQDLT